MNGIFVVGSVNVDLVLQVPHLPTIGETVLGGKFLQTDGGKGANQAIAAARLGRPATLIAAIGFDTFGQDALAELRREGVDVSAISTVSEATGIAVILVDSEGRNLIGVASGANGSLTADDVRKGLQGRLQPGDVVVGNLEVGDAAVLAAGRAARECGAWFVLNPAPARPIQLDLLAVCDVLTPNEVEIHGLGFAEPEDALAAGVGALIVTLGSNGADLYRRGHEKVHQSAFPMNVVDTTGAGDAFNAGLAVALAERQPLEVATRWAAAAGSLATQALGAHAGFPTASELFGLLSGSLASTGR